MNRNLMNRIVRASESIIALALIIAQIFGFTTAAVSAGQG